MGVGIPAGVYRRLGQAVLIEPYSGVTDGEQQFGSAVTVTAIVEETEMTDRTPTPGGDTATLAVARMPYDTDCPEGSRVTLESGNVGIVTDVKRWGRPTLLGAHLEVTLSAIATG